MSATASAATAAADTTATAATGPRTVMPTVFLTHGGGPSYFMEVPQAHPFHAISAKSLNAQWLRDFSKTYNLEGDSAPKAIVVVSAHFETSGQCVHVTSRKRHTKLNYDYGGFPPHTYQLQYPVDGAPELSAKIVRLLQAANLKAQLDERWDFDHGVFVPLLMMFPEGNIPIVELSIDSSYDPAYHLAVGKALTSLKHEGVLVIGSGSSTHNFRPSAAANKQFMESLEAIVASPSLTTEERAKKAVLEWAKIPSARAAHPQEDHLVPLFTVVGAAEDQKARVVGKVVPAGDWHMASILFDA